MKNKTNKIFRKNMRWSRLLLKITDKIYRRDKECFRRSLNEEFNPSSRDYIVTSTDSAARHFIGEMLVDNKTGPDFLKMQVFAKSLVDCIVSASEWLPEKPTDSERDEQIKKAYGVLGHTLQEAFMKTRTVTSDGLDLMMETFTNGHSEIMVKMMSHWMHERMKSINGIKNTDTRIPDRKVIQKETDRIYDIIVNDTCNENPYVMGSALMTIGKTLCGVADLEEMKNFDINNPDGIVKAMKSKVDRLRADIRDIGYEFAAVAADMHVGNPVDLAQELTKEFMETIGSSIAKLAENQSDGFNP